MEVILQQKREKVVDRFSFPTGFCSRLHKGGHYFVQINHFFIHGLCFQVFFTESPGFIFPHNFTVLLIADNFQNDGTCFVTGQIGRRQFERCLRTAFQQEGTLPFHDFGQVASGTQLELVLQIFYFSYLFYQYHLILYLVQIIDDILLGTNQTVG